MSAANRKSQEEKCAMRMWDELEGVPGRTTLIAAKLNVHSVTVVKWARKHGKKVVYPFPKPPRIDRYQVISLRQNGWAHRDIANILGCSKSRVTQLLLEEKQRYRDRGEDLPHWL